MNKSDVIKLILADQYLQLPKNSQSTAYAPSNIALVKYWGKRNQELNLPVTGSLSISLGEKGAQTSLSINNGTSDLIQLNNQPIAASSDFAIRLIKFLDLFRAKNSVFFSIDIQANIPIAAGLASSACGFAALVLALNQLYGWNLAEKELSILARLGSGSASRSIWNGFVEWQEGQAENGLDSHAQLLDITWPDFCIGLHIMTNQEKSISSRVAMQRTIETSVLYQAWPQKVAVDLQQIKIALQEKNFAELGRIAESNALTMHATMLAAWPPVSYAIPETIVAMQTIWKMRQAGISVYFTQDAGPNLKLLFLTKELAAVKSYFQQLEVIQPFHLEL